MNLIVRVLRPARALAGHTYPITFVVKDVVYTHEHIISHALIDEVGCDLHTN